MIIIVKTDMTGTVAQYEHSGEYLGICIRCSAHITPEADTIKSTTEALIEHNNICPKK